MKTHPPAKLHWEQGALLLIFFLASGRLWALSGWHLPPTSWQEIGALVPQLSHLWPQQGLHLLPPLLLLVLEVGELPGALLFLFLGVGMLVRIVSVLTGGFKSAWVLVAPMASNSLQQLTSATRTILVDGHEPALRALLASNTLPGSNLCGIFAILDGRASRSNAGQAVSLLIEPIRQLLQEATANPRRYQKTFKSLLLQTLQQANVHIFEYNHTHQEAALRGTATILVVLERVAYIGHIGTNRIYLSREHEGLHLLTTDHGLPRDEGHSGNRLMGEMAHVLCDILTIPLQEGDLLLLCSEEIGITMPETAIEQILQTHPQETLMVEALLHAVQEKNGPQTTVSVIVVRLPHTTQRVRRES